MLWQKGNKPAFCKYFIYYYICW